MAGSKIVAMDAHAIVKLWTHYTEGRMPLDAELKGFAISKILPRQVAFIVESKQWQERDTPQPGKLNAIHLRYEGKRVMSWNSREQGSDAVWSDANETPKFQG